MWKFYFKYAVRNLISHRLVSFLVLISLCTGFITYLMVAGYVGYEKSYDKVFAESDNIYRVTTDIFVGGELRQSKPLCERSMGSSLVEKYPEVKQAGFLCRLSNHEYKIGENLFRNDNIFFASAGIIDIFSIELIQGNRNNILSNPYTLIISESMAKRYFGDENPVGKTVYKYPTHEYTIKGIYKDIPDQAHFKADMLLSFHNKMHLPPPVKTNWGETAFYTYLKLDKDADLDKLNRGINQLAIENKEGYFKKTNTEHKYSLQPVESIHLNSHMQDEITTNSRGDYLNILLIVAFLIVIASGLNYIYFSFTKSIKNAGNTGIQKIVGASSRSILGMAIIESLLLHFIAILISALICYLVAPVIENRFGVNIDLSLYNGLFRTGLGIILISSILLNGLVPAITLNAKKGIDLLKLRHKSAQGKISLRQVLVVAQFSIVIGIIVSILSIDKQVDFLVNKEKGLSVNNKLVITTPKYMGRASNRFNNLNAFEQELVRHPNIEGVSMGSAVPGSSAAHNFTFSEEGSDASGKAALIITDRNFIENYNIQLIEGENFSSGLKGCIINKTCLSQLGYKSGEEALGKNLKMTDDSQMQKLSYKIIGVTEDYNFQSAKKHPEAMILIDLTEKMVWGNYTVALNSANYSSVIPFVKKHFETTFPNYPFEYFVPEDLYKTEMKSEAQLLSMLKIFVLIALAISIINLFSMALHNASARVKEIGIRKVNGAKISEVMTLLNKDFLKWVVIASVIACPVTYYAMNKWLENFAYRTTLSWWLFVLAGVLALGIAILTVSWQSWKAATRNPIEALRYE